MKFIATDTRGRSHRYQGTVVVLHEDDAETVVKSEFLEVTELHHGSGTCLRSLASVYLRAQLKEGQQGGCNGKR